MTDGAFDSWHEPDLMRFLRTFAVLSDQQREVSAADVRDAMGLDDDAALAALRRLRTLHCIEDSPWPARMSEGELELGRVLTAIGTTAVLEGQLPRYA